MSGIIHTSTTEWRTATQDKLTSRAIKEEVLRVIGEERRASEFGIRMQLGAFFTKDVTRFLPTILEKLVTQGAVIRDIEVETAMFGEQIEVAVYSLARE